MTTTETPAPTGHGYDCDPGCRCAPNLASGRGGTSTPIPPTHVLWARINDREGIARVLGEHSGLATVPDPDNAAGWLAECECGEQIGDPNSDENAIPAWRTHQADALIAHLTATEAQR